MFELPLKRPAIMGILNVTPDSFSDGGKFTTIETAIIQAELMLSEGADIIDIGGESTRPGAIQISLQEELDRVLPVIEKLKGLPLSIDTYKAKVADLAISSGCKIINDISALGDSEMGAVAVKHRVPICLMHRGGVLKQESEVAIEVGDYLSNRIRYALSFGLNLSQIWIDPGFGFGKTKENDLELLRHLDQIVEIGQPVLVGMSRKRLIGALLSEADSYQPSELRPVSERIYGSVSAHLWAVQKGARIVRVHDVQPMRDALMVWQALKNEIGNV